MPKAKTKTKQRKINVIIKQCHNIKKEDYDSDEDDFSSEGGSSGGHHKHRAVAPVATVTQGTTSATFHIPRSCNILSDGKSHKVSIALIDLSLEFTYIAVPLISNKVYLKSRCINDSKYFLLPGPLHVFMDNFFVTTSSLPSTSYQAPFELYLGVDEAIKLEFVAHDKTGKAGFVIKKSKTIEKEHVTTITNNKPNKIIVVIYDQVPQASDQAIKVKVHEPAIQENGPVTYTASKNLRWRVELSPAETKELKLSYVIEWPKDKDVHIT